MNGTMRDQASACASFQMPASSGEMRPSGETELASVNTSPAPPTARLPRCTRCQSVGTPPGEEYWHIGDTTMRLRNASAPSLIGSSNIGDSGEHFVLPSCGQ